MVATWTGGIPSHGLLRVQSSHMITPKLKISHFFVNGSLRMSSGAIHSGVPAGELSFIAESDIIWESPKSHILTVQYLLTRQFALLRSRWTIFSRCMHMRPLVQHDNKNIKGYRRDWTIWKTTGIEQSRKLGALNMLTYRYHGASLTSSSNGASFCAFLNESDCTKNPIPCTQWLGISEEASYMHQGRVWLQ